MSWVGVALAVFGAVQGNQAKQRAKGEANKQARLAEAQNLTSQQTQPYIKPFYDRAQRAYDPAFAHYRALASGDRSQIIGAVAPQLADVNARYGSLISASRNLNPRSGSGATYNADLAFRAGDDRQRIIDQERASAYPALSAMAGQAGNIAASAAGVSTNAGNGASNLYDNAYTKRRQGNIDANGAYTQAGQSMYDAYKHYSNGKSAPASSGGSGLGTGGMG